MEKFNWKIFKSNILDKYRPHLTLSSNCPHALFIFHPLLPTRLWVQVWQWASSIEGSHGYCVLILPLALPTLSRLTPCMLSSLVFFLNSLHSGKCLTYHRRLYLLVVPTSGCLFSTSNQEIWPDTLFLPVLLVWLIFEVWLSALCKAFNITNICYT